MSDAGGTVLTMWTIYFSPLDALYVVRAVDCYPHVPNPIPRDESFVRESLDAARAVIPAGLFRLERSEHDHDSVVETWF